jgi:GNAT superfamily N-acetyltransferase
MMLIADPDLIARWASAWAISRGVAMPVARDGGLYTQVDQPEQFGRYLFAQIDADAIRPLAASIDRPFLFLKICAPAEAVRPLLPSGWEIATPGYMMTAPLSVMLDRPVTIAAEFEMRIEHQGAITSAYIYDVMGEEAAHGHLITVDALAVYDRIHTADHYQRRGLGSAIMRALAAEAGRSGVANATLSATPAGRELYTALGWSLHSDYTTASLPATQNLLS